MGWGRIGNCWVWLNFIIIGTQTGRQDGELAGWVGSSHDDDDGVMLIKCVKYTNSQFNRSGNLSMGFLGLTDSPTLLLLLLLRYGVGIQRSVLSSGSRPRVGQA